MLIFKRRLIGVCIALLWCSLWAPKLAAQDVTPMLEKLTIEQKKQVLQAMQTMHSDLNEQIQCAFEQLNNTNQVKAMSMLAALQPQTNGKPIRTEVSWSRDTLQFGTLDDDKTFIDSVLLVNTGDKPYTVSQVQTSCDCALISNPISVLMPGDITTVRIQINTKGKKGKVRGAIVFVDNSSPNARSILYVQGTIKSANQTQKRPWE